jgi:hypothetical protein
MTITEKHRIHTAKCDVVSIMFPYVLISNGLWTLNKLFGFIGDWAGFAIVQGLLAVLFMIFMGIRIANIVPKDS